MKMQAAADTYQQIALDTINNLQYLGYQSYQLARQPRSSGYGDLVN